MITLSAGVTSVSLFSFIDYGERTRCGRTLSHSPHRRYKKEATGDFSVFRFYGPTEARAKKTCKLGDFEEMKCTRRGIAHENNTDKHRAGRDDNRVRNRRA
jgi:hypothetical protein